MSGDEHTIGPWICAEELGRGGNATVWRAHRDGERDVALKVVRTTKAQAEPYRRFVREVDFLRQLGDYPGVLPVLETHLPDPPSSADRAWLAMPIATPIRSALDDEPLEAVVRAAQAVADTLARLSAEHGVGHRDIKPGNLYTLNGKSLVGDFGLIDIPDLDELTRAGQKLGPANFTAYEVILDPVTGESGPADVYALGKTLWVLATGINWPPNGHQPATSRGHVIAEMRPHPHAGHLDALIDRMTRLDLTERPHMRQVADDLAAWLNLAGRPVAFDVSDDRAILRAKLGAEIAAHDLQEQRKALAHAAVRSLQERIRPLNEALLELHPRAEIDGNDRLTTNTLGIRRHRVRVAVLFSWVRCSTIAAGSAHFPYALRMGRSVDLTDDGRLHIQWVLDVGPLKTPGNDFRKHGRNYEAAVGSIEQEAMLDRFANDLRDELTDALRVFAERTPDGDR